MTASVDTKSLEAGMRKLQKVYGVKSVLHEMGFVAQALIKKSIDSPIPSDTRFLANSSAVNVDEGGKRVIFGFNRAYAAFQDAPGRSSPYVVKPRRTQWLYVPVSQRGRQHRLGANPQNEGLIFGGFSARVGGGGSGGGGSGSADYILAKEVVIHIKPYGSSRGPNHYFSETVKRNVRFALRALAKRLENRLGKEFPSHGGS